MPAKDRAKEPLHPAILMADGGMFVGCITPNYEVTQHRTLPDATPILRTQTMRSVYEYFNTVFVRMRKCRVTRLTAH